MDAHHRQWPSELYGIVPVPAAHIEHLHAAQVPQNQEPKVFILNYFQECDDVSWLF
jgi:GTP-dependent phosphoenolpyruvate carboxykinase